MKLTLLALLILCISCKSRPPKTPENEEMDILQTSSEAIPAEKVPQNVTDYLKNNIPHWIIPDTSEYSKAWWSFFENDALPFFVATEINGDGVSDYGLILKNGNDLGLFVLIGADKTFKLWKANDFKETIDENPIHFGLRIEETGEYNYFVDDSDKNLYLQFKGIALMDLEMKQRIYYWSNGEMKAFKVR